MRQVFSSQRVETVEGVAELLREAGIEVHVSNGSSYHGKRSGQFSYLDPVDPKTQPAVWVVRADDQTRAREILREHRLIDTTRRDQPQLHYAFAQPAGETATKASWAWRIRIVLLLVIAAVAVLIAIGHRAARNAPPPAPRPPATTPAAPEEDEVRVRIAAPDAQPAPVPAKPPAAPSSPDTAPRR